MEKKKVAFLISHPVQYFSPLFKKLAGRPEIDLTVLYCSDESVRGMRDKGFGQDVKWDIPLLEGYKYKFLKNHSPVSTIFTAPFGLINFGVANEIKKGGYDALIMHGWHYVTFWLAYFAARRAGIPVFLRSEMPFNQEIRKSGFKLFIKKLILRPVFQGMAGFFAIGSENRKFYEFYGVPASRIFLTPYAVDNERLIGEYEANRHRRAEFKKEIGLSPESVVILFSGKLIPKKRPMDLLRAFELLRSEALSGEAVSKSPSPYPVRLSSPSKSSLIGRGQVRGAELVFLGDGPLRGELEKYAAAKGIKGAHFAGFRNQTELQKYYISADIFILPSGPGETWGLVVNEAMCFSLPVAVSATAGCSADLVKDGESGFVFPEGDINAIAERLGQLIQDETSRKRMGEKSREMIDRWNYEKCTENMLRAFNGT